MVSVRDDRGSAGKTEGGYVNAPPSVTLTPWPPFCGAGTLDWAQPATRLANRRLPHRNTGTDQLQLAQAIHHFAKYNVPRWALPHHTQFTGTSTLVAAAAAKHSIDTAAAAATHDGVPARDLTGLHHKKHSQPAFSTLCVGCPLIQCLLGSPGWVHFQNYNKHAVHVLLGHQIQPADRVLGHFGGDKHAVHPRGGGAGDRAGIDLVTNSPPQQATYPAPLPNTQW